MKLFWNNLKSVLEQFWNKMEQNDVLEACFELVRSGGQVCFQGSREFEQTTGCWAQPELGWN
jgi:hypothetical protein